jgi:hypothetical protein
MRSTTLAPVLLVPALLVTGCLREPELEATYSPTEQAPAQPMVRRDVTVNWQRSDDEEAPVVVLAASPRDRLQPDPIPFRIGAGHGALGGIDLAPCREQGLPPGYLAMRVTFHHDGRVAHAVVEGPVPPPQEALDCVAEQIQGAKVPVFDGRDASLTKRFFVQADGTEGEPGDTVVRKGGAPDRRKALESAGLSRR